MLAAVLFLPCSVSALSAQKAILVDTVTGRPIYQLNSNSRSLIASTTKIMTALLVCEQCNVLDRMRVPAQAVGIEGSSMYLQAGEILTIQELLYGLMMSSGNDAAVALAIYCGGNVEGFCGMMNDKAKALGMTQTHFSNPNGLDAVDHYSTARDLGILAAYAMENPIFAKTVSTKTIKAGERYLRNHNKLLWLYEGADGVKTGYTKAAGRILVSSAKRDNRRLVAVTINDPNDWQDHQALLNRGFSEYSVRQVISCGQVLGNVAVVGGTLPNVDLIAQEDFSYSLCANECVQFLKAGTDFVYAPVVKGADAGYVYVLLNGKAVGKVKASFGQTVEMPQSVKKKWWKF